MEAVLREKVISRSYRGVSEGAKALENLKKYALDFLTAEERVFVETADKKVNNLLNGDNGFLNWDGKNNLGQLWRKYHYLRPFFFTFDPEKTMPTVFQNKQAFIIWTIWRSWCVLGDEDLKGAALAAANFLADYQPPYSMETKTIAVSKFNAVMAYERGSLSDFCLWIEDIFPFLEGVWKFSYELKLQ